MVAGEECPSICGVARRDLFVGGNMSVMKEHPYKSAGFLNQV
jgi:hypothetical protein